MENKERIRREIGKFTLLAARGRAALSAALVERRLKASARVNGCSVAVCVGDAVNRSNAG